MYLRSVLALAGLLAVSSTGLIAQFSDETGSWVFRNYSTKEYGGTPDSYGFAQDKRGIVYIANSGSVLQFDGISWLSITPDDSSIVRSVAAGPDGAIYVGGTGTFGVIRPDAEGKPKYTSLLPRVAVDHRQFGPVWRVLPTKEGIYFSSYNRLFRLNSDGKVQDWTPQTTFGRAFEVSGVVYVKTPEHGLLALRGERLEPVPGGEMLATVSVEDAIPYGNDALIGTANRIYRMTATGMEPFPTASDAYFATNVIYSMRALNADTIAVGTRTGGLVLLDPATRATERVITKDDGLPDNFVTSISNDVQGGIWLTTRSGIGRFNAGLTTFDGKHGGLASPVFAHVRHRDALYVGTSAGLFVMRAAPSVAPGFEQVDGIAKKNGVWSLLSRNDDLLVAADDGVYNVSPKGAEQIFETRQKIFDLSNSVAKRDTVYAAGRAGVYRLQEIDGKWQQTAFLPVKGQDFASILDDNEGNVWATTRDSVWRFNFDRPGAHPDRFGAPEGVAPGWIFAKRLAGRVVFTTPKGLRLFSPKTNRFVPDNTLGTQFADGSRDVVNFFEEPSGNVWVTGNVWMAGDDEHKHGRKYHGILSPKGKDYQWRPSPLIAAGIDEIFAMSFDQDGTVWAAGSDGVLFRWSRRLAGNPDRNFDVLLRSVGIEGDANPIYGGEGPGGAGPLPYRAKKMRFEFLAPFFEDPAAVDYQVLLDGYDTNWSPWKNEHSRDYTSLPGHDYSLRVRARSPHGAVAEEQLFTFTVLPPWYRTWTAYSVYAILAAFAVWGIVRVRVRQLEADKRQLEHVIEERTVEIRQQRDEIHVQERKSHSLLLNILPAQVADELKATGAVKPVHFDDVTVCFTDFVGFTLSSEKLQAADLVNALNEYFTAFDEIVSRYKLEKLKTIGDSYMFVSGLPDERDSHAVDAVMAAMEMAEVVKRLAEKPGGTGWNIRIGLHSGPVVAGVVGNSKFAFDIWGNTVNFAARMESSGVPGYVNMSETTCRLTRGLVDCDSRGQIRIKEGRELPMFLARRLVDDFAARYRQEFDAEPASVPAQIQRIESSFSARGA